MNGLLQNIPDLLRALMIWALFVVRDGKKIPVQPSGRPAKVNDESTLNSFEEVLEACEGKDETYPAFRLSPDLRVVGVDLDNCFDEDGNLKAWAESIVEATPSYAEVSQSGRGLHLLLKGEKPSGKGCRVSIEDGGLEVYDRDRFLIVTGNVWNGRGEILEDQRGLDFICDFLPDRDSVGGSVVGDLEFRADAEPSPELLEALLAENPKFRRRYEGSPKGLNDKSASSFDMSLAIFAKRAGCSDQETLNILIAARRKRGDQLHLDNEQKYLRTIERASDLASRDQPSYVLAPEQDLPFPVRTPSKSAVSLGGVLDEGVSLLRKYVALVPGAAEVLVAWSLHTYLFTHALITPRLAILSPQPQCGKTTLLNILRLLVHRPMMVANLSPAVLFRAIEKYGLTVLIDEFDTQSTSTEIRGIINAGHERNGRVARAMGVGNNNFEPQFFSVFSPVAIAAIGTLPDTILSRSLPIPMRRKLPGQEVARLRVDRVEEFEVLASRLCRAAMDHESLVIQQDPEVPAGLPDRAVDNVIPLLQIADAAGDGWDERLRGSLLSLLTGC